MKIKELLLLNSCTFKGSNSLIFFIYFQGRKTLIFIFPSFLDRGQQLQVLKKFATSSTASFDMGTHYPQYARV